MIPNLKKLYPSVIDTNVPDEYISLTKRHMQISIVVRSC